MYAKVKKLSAKKNVSSKSATIKDDAGKLLTDPEEVRKRWKEYIETLYDKNGKPKSGDLVLGSEGDINEDCKGPDLIDSEIVSAIGEMKKNKAVGVDNIPAEFWKVLGESGMKELIGLCKEIYEQGVWPEDHTRVIMMPLQKKPNAVECEDHRTISLISHVSKILLKVAYLQGELKVKRTILLDVISLDLDGMWYERCC